MARKANEPTFEEALEKLESTVRQLEGDQISLEDSLALFEEGVRLSRQCSEQLDQAEQRVLSLIEGEGGALTLAPLNPSGGSARE